MRLRAVPIPLLVATAFLVWQVGFAPHPLPLPLPFQGELPAASPPAGMALFQIPTAVTHRSAAFAVQGGSFWDKRDFAMTAVLVRHPRGDLLIDSGIGRDGEAHLRTLPAAFRAITDLERMQSVGETFERVGYSKDRLRGVLLTHSHWDHVSGLAELSNVPVLVNASERRYVEEGGTITALARSFPNVKYELYDFDGGPYLGFAKSHDVYGDGSIVVVPAPGHTPGSVIVFVALPTGKRFAFVGDLVWQRDGIAKREERPWLWRTIADADPGEVREGIERVVALSQRFPEMEIVPAHDQRGFESIPCLTKPTAL